MATSRQEFLLQNVSTSTVPSLKQINDDPGIIYRLAVDGKLRMGRTVDVSSSSLMIVFSVKLVLDNIPRLTEYYNSTCLPSLKQHFPDFYEDLSKSGYAKQARVPCDMRACNEDELREQTNQMKPARRLFYTAKVEALRSAMRDEGVDFEPVTAELLRLSVVDWVSPEVHNPLMQVIEHASQMYEVPQWGIRINRFLRSMKDDTSDYRETTGVLTTFLPGLLFPFTADHELVVYRGDNLNISTDFFVVRGMLSTSLALDVTEQFGGARKLKITMPAGTPFLPLIVFGRNLAEIALLPGTRLELIQERRFPDGLFAEYKVTANPTPFTGLQIATILRAYLSQDGRNTVARRDVPDDGDRYRFICNLVNQKYNGDL